MPKHLLPCRALAAFLLTDLLLLTLTSCHQSQIDFVNEIQQKDQLFQASQPHRQPAEIQQKR